MYIAEPVEERPGSRSRSPPHRRCRSRRGADFAARADRLDRRLVPVGERPASPARGGSSPCSAGARRRRPRPSAALRISARSSVVDALAEVGGRRADLAVRRSRAPRSRGRRRRATASAWTAGVARRAGLAAERGRRGSARRPRWGRTPRGRHAPTTTTTIARHAAARVARARELRGRDARTAVATGRPGGDHAGSATAVSMTDCVATTDSTARFR